MQKRDHLFKLCSLLCILSLFACKAGTVNLFKAASPHEAYQRKLISAGLDKTAMGSAWIQSAEIGLQKPVSITIPFKETGYFAAEKVPVATYRFNAVKGQKINISLSQKPSKGTMVYVDFWLLANTNTPKLLASRDTLGNNIQFDIDESGDYLVRLQPELLQSVEYTLEITTGPSLAFPTSSKSSSSIKSYWGDGRDDNARKHEGVDIFGRFRSLVLAIAEGTVTRVNENNLGGKVVWLRPKGKNYTLYYAHLDEQIAIEGQEVKIGDTLGLMGNTGNAKTTPTHLHFGIYEFSGAVNPLPFINPVSKTPAAISASLTNLNKTLRTVSVVKLYANASAQANVISSLPTGTIVNINAASSNFYKSELPDGRVGFIKNADLSQTTKPLKQLKIKANQTTLYNRPDSLAPKKLNLREGETVSVLGTFGNYQLINNENMEIGWITK
ncbi:hypothetical protein DHW03_12755 [Pedobacter yonginense]|uniref:M23ase beta-sheet core domain-containing protein n=1 Tax=Pedobacter yonginense TaxID=651869 RepID=A0A317EJ79_9SPHI|nr:M23 family metallopeptidase [Pedobacter yonginense]PWS26890.1 hypothetical protein DHW03_12755 [Pedobacter yonginense]